MNVSGKRDNTKCIIEGQAEIRLTSDKVFYNPVQEFNRDLSIAVLNVFTEDYKAEKLAKALKNIKKLSDNEIIEDRVGDTEDSGVCLRLFFNLSHYVSYNT